MSTPGGPGDPHHQYYRVDPITGEQVTGPGQQSGMQYQGFGLYAENNLRTGPPPKRRAPLVAGVVVTVVLVTALVTTSALIVTSSSENEAAPPPPEPTAPVAPPPESESPEPTPEEESTGTPSDDQEFVPASVPGWTGVSWPNFEMVYDVPPDWSPEPGVLSGMENAEGDREILSATSVYLPDVCPEAGASYRAKIGVTVGDVDDPVSAARTKMESWARIGLSGEDGSAPPPVRFNPPQPVRVNDGRTEATLVSGTVTPAPGGECPAPNVYLAAIAFDNDTEGSSPMLFAHADQEVPDAVPPEVVDQALQTFRRP
ncbi:hypothetical protein GIY23_16280 [Allosaccharopolyspora coralli]|uniref:DUF8017 domain-containing protein n=1 Tax=Allosaccharopolyspora coralli TaxID=2665642 RepID=A0A5Q3Q8I2_9PSEU|nr:hypothetical protein [Allosaccharopolyspora coralli]QGK70868.1 hypothetical protein GIY23_16280 [Allosaccharopolyspora coralli]